MGAPGGDIPAVLGGLSLKEPTYTLHTSGVMNTLPRLHISAPYTRISCWAPTWSAAPQSRPRVIHSRLRSFIRFHVSFTRAFVHSFARLNNTGAYTHLRSTACVVYNSMYGPFIGGERL